MRVAADTGFDCCLGENVGLDIADAFGADVNVLHAGLQRMVHVPGERGGVSLENVDWCVVLVVYGRGMTLGDRRTHYRRA